MNVRLFSLRKRNLEFLTSLFAIVWGAWVLNPLFSTFNSAPIFNIMKELAPEWVWGAIFFISGFVGLISLGTEILRLRIISNSIVMYLFITLSILMGVSDIRNTACPIYAIVSLCSYLSAQELFSELRQKKKVTEVKI